jgi:hypothetical protein
MGRSTRWVALILAWAVLLPALAFAQGSITGTVKDATGAFLPGVTVEASSPVLIEKARSVVTDGAGRYQVVDLRPGAYSVTFTLPGFTQFKRDGIELTGSFAATVDAELKLGSVEETITVSGVAPIVDVQTVTQQRVLSKEIIDAIPAGRGQSALAVLVPGMITGGQDVGGQNTQSLSAISIHGGRGTDQRQAVDGLTLRNVAGEGNSTNTVVDVGASQELTIDYAAGSAEAITGGVLFNFIPREGGNRFTGSFFGTVTNSDFQNSNFTPELEAQGLRAPNRLKHLHDINGSVGGPIAQDRVWFYSSARFQDSQGYVSGMWDNLNAGDITKWNYEPDLAKQTNGKLESNSVNTRFTWQASQRNKINVYWDQQYRHWDFRPAGTSPESAQTYDFPRLHTGTASWTSPLSNKLLLDVRGAIHGEDIRNFYPADPNSVWRKLIGVVEQNAVLPNGVVIPNLRYRGRANANDTGIAANDQIESGTAEIKASLSYVTGSHALKFGVTNLHGIQTYNSPDSQTPYNYRFNNGVPNQITQRQNQYFGIRGGVRSELGAFAQDKWTIRRLTLNAGVRFDHAVTGWEEFRLGPGPLVPNRDIFFPDTPWYQFNDFSPRIAGAYDVVGNGRTAVKVNVGRYMNALLPTAGNPISTRLVNRVTRVWTDVDSDYHPDCDLINPLAQDLRTSGGDFCGQISDLRFGTPIPSTSYDPETLHGWNRRQNNWEVSTSVQHEIVRGLGIDIGYFRRWYNNFTVTENRAVTPADYAVYSISAPVDARLPNGGGYVIGGLRDINPNAFGRVDNYVTLADNFGGQTEVFNGVDISANARMRGVLLRGGISTGQTTQDTCNIVRTNFNVTVTSNLGGVQSFDMCRVETPFLTQGKLLATYNVPKVGVDVAATFQNLPGPLISSNYIATNAVVQPSLGRPLSGSVNTTVNLIQPGTLYGERLNQLDLRFTKGFRVGRNSIKGNFDIYNATNGNTVRTVNANYAAWLTPTGILDPRLFKISAQIDF